MKILDLCCKAGGASVGIHEVFPNAEITGVDIEPQPNYPFKFVLGDALTYPINGYDFIWASPPCQAYSFASAYLRHGGVKYPDILLPIRERLVSWGGPYCIENVYNAYMKHPVIMLCGLMFDMKLIRHRLFETCCIVKEPKHPKHVGTVKARDYVTVAGHGGDGSGKLKDWQEAMGIYWMNKHEMANAVPPKYAKYMLENLMLNHNTRNHEHNVKTKQQRMINGWR